MEFGFTEEQEKLRKELNDFYSSELPGDYKPQSAINAEQQSFWMAMQKKAGARGYLTPGWPKEYGGLGFGAIEQGIAAEEQSKFHLMWPNGIGFALAGPVTILFGTDEQKKEFIPPIARGEAIWFELFTEPEAGSDEANQQTRAVEDGDDYIVNGQKIFISGIHKPDYLLTEVRTADTVPKHRGISLLLIPADLPGITSSPLPTMGGLGAQNQFFFDDVRVPKRYLLGELNRGFYHVMSTLEMTRASTGWPAGSKQTLQELIQFCREEKRNGKPLIEDPEVRKELAQMAMEIEVFRLVSWHGQWWFGQREKLGPKPYDLTGFFTKLFTARHAKVMMDILGNYGQLRTGSKWAKYAGRIERNWQAARSPHAGGTIDIYKVTLAQRGLGLPRIPATFNKQIAEALK